MNLVFKANKAVFANALKTQALSIIGKIQPLVENAVDTYLNTLQQEIGGVPGDTSVVVNGVMWQALVTGENNFWHRSGELESAIAVGYKVLNNGLQVIVGISPDSPAYDKALWNEYGFYPHDSDKLVRRPLFTPLAEMNVIELNKLVKTTFSKVKVVIKVKN